MQRLDPKPKTSVRVTPQLIRRNELLRLPSHRLGGYLVDLTYENPLLDVVEHELCPRCRHVIPPELRRCTYCYNLDETYSGTPGGLPAVEDQSDWLDSISDSAEITEYLWRQCVEAGMTAVEREIACHLIGDLDERGLSMTPVEEHAALLGYSDETVEKVRQRLMRLDPLGAGAYDSRECLLIQAEVHRAGTTWGTVAFKLIHDHWTLLMKGDLKRIARALALSLTNVQEAYMGIRAHFHFYPSSGYMGSGNDTLLIQPDVRYLISGSGGSATVEVDILEARRYQVRYARGQARCLGGATLTDEERGRVLEWKYDVGRVARALRQRWQTMEQVCRMIGQFQRDFFLGDFSPHSLTRLTREDVARALEVHPSTVGRAVAGKYAELPNRRIVPLAFFFDSSAPIHALISDLIDEENGQLSDDMLQSYLQRAGWTLTRRAVSLHRESMGILPSHLRLRQRRLYELLNENGYSIAR